MNVIKKKILETKFNILVLKNKNNKIFIKKIKETFNKDEFEYLINNKKNAKILLNKSKTNYSSPKLEKALDLFESDYLEAIFEIKKHTKTGIFELLVANMSLDNIIALNKHFKKNNKILLENYLKLLPFNKTSASAYEQNGFYTMQLTESLGLLGEHYDYSYNQREIHEIIMIDKINNF